MKFGLLKPLTIIFVFGFVALCGAGIWVEARTIYNPSFPPPKGFWLKPSTLRSHDLLRECNFDFYGFRRQYYQDGMFEEDLKICLGLAGEIAHQRPTQGYAWFIKATGEHLSGDAAVALGSLSTSQHVTPREAWLAVRRLELWLELVDEFETSQMPGFSSDLMQALRFENGRQLAAVGYVLNPDLRPVLDDILLQVPTRQQNATLREISRILEGGQ